MKPASALLIVIALGYPFAASAQETPPPPASYATYYECNQAQVARVDSLMRSSVAPVLDRQLERGRISAWGWSAHHTGGHWRRVLYFVAADLNRLFDAQEEIVRELQRSQPAAFREIISICPTHEDYIWRAVAGSRPSGEIAQDRAPTGLSTYLQCDVARETRADTLLTQAFAPFLNRRVAAGELKSWGWLSHVVGGPYRRLLILEGPAHKAVIAALEKSLAEAAQTQAAALQEFGAICGSHQDYLWDITIARPGS